MWKIKLIFLIVFVTIVQSDQMTDAIPVYKCSISEDFVSYLFTGLINEYKYEDIQMVYTFVDEINKKLDFMDDHLRKALRGDYDNEVRNFGFSTV